MTTETEPCDLCGGSGWIPGVAPFEGPMDELPCPACPHPYRPQVDVAVNVCECGGWPLHHVHTADRAACTCDACTTATIPKRQTED